MLFGFNSTGYPCYSGSIVQVTAGEAERTEVTGQGVGGSTGIRPTHARSAAGPGYKDLMHGKHHLEFSKNKKA